ncbi:MAG: CDP-diacylglycerol--glycerol-3-phosphate 3-phosphatidyltransferase [Xanthomonadales bacterium]|jgi:CDP-diacylglycerol--glycerol-3-phosphate 3-phosphatidyltransferase|nr:CDP-diacylglycerol--glycerol-3-phosphate 3-phosphatidyltransferase [Xanthomonadales bacterium]
MKITLPTWLTLLRIAIIPVLVLVFYLPIKGANFIALALFILASVTDWLDGWLARRYNWESRFGAFLDPVADKLMVGIVLVLLVQQEPSMLMAIASAVIIGREITVSALREWMSSVGARATVKVSMLGKFKTTLQMLAIGFLLFSQPLWGLPIMLIGKALLVGAAILTLWSMILYLKAAWPTLNQA